MVGLDFFLWAFSCHVSAFSTVKTCSFSFAAVHFSLAGFLSLSAGRLLHRCLAFACALRRRGLSIGVLLFWLLGLTAGALVSILVSIGPVQNGIIAFSYSDHLVPSVFWSEL